MKTRLLLLVLLLQAMGIFATERSGVDHATPRVVFLKATPRTIERGETVKVSWVTTGAKRIVLEWQPIVASQKDERHRLEVEATGSIVDRPVASMVVVK